MQSEPNIVDLEQQHVLQTYKRPNFVLSHGEGVWLYDTAGTQYLDAGSGIAVTALGHSHAAVVQAIKDGAEGLLHVSNLYHTAPQALLARDLCQACPMADKVYFCNSGAEANEGAIKFARKVAKMNGQADKTDLVAFSHSFHGRTMGALALTSREKYRKPFEPLIGNTHFAEFNDLDSAAAVINEGTCAVIVEPVQGEGGVTPATPEFMAGLRQLCNEHDALLIADEIQCGLGRTGSLWAHSHEAQPDMMTIAKPLGGGLPIGAVLVNERVAQAIQPGDHGSTFAGGPLVCQVARTVLNTVNQPSFLAEVQAKGNYLREKLKALVSRTPLLDSVRGKGLMWGVVSNIPASEIMAEAYNHQLMILTAGDKIVRLLPPLTISKDEIDLLIDRLSQTLEGVG